MIRIRVYKYSLTTAALGRINSLQKSRLIPAAVFSSMTQDEKREKDSEYAYHVHFRESTSPHPLHAKDRKHIVDIKGLPHYIWTPEEIDERMKSLYFHKPQTFSDRVIKQF